MPTRSRTARILLVLLVPTIAACNLTGGSHQELQGDCDPPAGTVAVTVGPSWSPQSSSSCLLPAGSTLSLPFERFRSRAELAARIDLTACPSLSVADGDFATREVVLVRGYDPERGGITVRFAAEDASSRYLGLLGRAVGFPTPDFLVRLPASNKPLTARMCREVCVGDCPAVP